MVLQWIGLPCVGGVVVLWVACWLYLAWCLAGVRVVSHCVVCRVTLTSRLCGLGSVLMSFSDALGDLLYSVLALPLLIALSQRCLGGVWMGWGC